MNLMIFEGNLVADIELRTTQNGKSVTNFRVLRNEYVRKDETRVVGTTWVAFDKDAEDIAKHFEKGKRISLRGRLQNKKWQDKDGNNRYSDEYVVEKWDFVSSGFKKEDETVKEDKSPAPKTVKKKPSTDDINF